MNAEPIVFYHKNCLDGAMAAAVFLHGVAAHRRRASDQVATLRPWEYGEDLGEMQQYRDREIWLLDMVFPEATMALLRTVAKSIHVLDHHPEARRQSAAFSTHWNNVTFIVDNEECPQSGAQLTWSYFNPDTPQPNPVRWIGKRDLWIFDEPEIKYFAAGCQSLGYEPERWRELIFGEHADANVATIVQNGHIRQEVVDSQLDYLERYCCHRRIIAGYSVISVNAARFFTSEIAERLYNKYSLEESEFIAVFHEVQGSVEYSLRSKRESQVHLGEIAALFGGNGHAHAAGFKVTVHRAPLMPKFEEAVPVPQSWWDKIRYLWRKIATGIV